MNERFKVQSFINGLYVINEFSIENKTLFKQYWIMVWTLSRFMDC